MKYNLTEEDIKYLKEYSTDEFPRPSLTSDLVVLTVSKPESLGKLLLNGKLEILLVKRDHSPFKGLYGLPGGFCVPYEDAIESAKRLLFEETNAKVSSCEISGVYGSFDRDPRGWIISNSFLCLIRKDVVDIRVDKWETKWFDIDFKEEDNKYYLCLKADNIEFNNVLEIKNGKLELIKSDLAFDHALIIVDNLIKLSKKVKDNYKLAFNCLDLKFTLTEFQNVVENLTFSKLIKPNFRRDIKSLVKETNDYMTQGQFRPAKLYTKLEE